MAAEGQLGMGTALSMEEIMQAGGGWGWGVGRGRGRWRVQWQQRPHS